MDSNPNTLLHLLDTLGSMEMDMELPLLDFTLLRRISQYTINSNRKDIKISKICHQGLISVQRVLQPCVAVAY